jgi:hypothetical protein
MRIAGGNLNQTVSIPFLGESYVINKHKTTEMELVKGEEKTLGIGQSVDVTFGTKTYTVKLDDARLNEVATEGQATVTITVDGSSTTLTLDTANAQTKKVGDFLVFLQSVAKSYTPGQGGSATVRLGGDVITMKSGQVPTDSAGNELYNGDWKVNLVNNAASTRLTEIDLVYVNSVKTSDEMDKIMGPNDYFSLSYAGDEVSRSSWETETVEASMENNDDSSIDTITYVDNGNKGGPYTVGLNSEGEYQYAVLANDTNGAIAANANATYWKTQATGSIYFVPPATLPSTAIGDFNNTGFYTLFQNDIFFVNDIPIEIANFVQDSTDTPGNAYVLFTAYAGSSKEQDFKVYATDTHCTSNDRGSITNSSGLIAATTTTVAGSAPVGSWSRCTLQDMLVGGAVTFGWAWNASYYAGDPFIVVEKGADEDIETRFGTIHWVQNTGVNRNERGGIVVAGLDSGPTEVNVTDAGGSVFWIHADNLTDYPGINVTDVALALAISQDTNSASDEDKMYQYTDGAWIEATSSSSVKFTIPEGTLNRHNRIALIRGAMSVSDTGETTVTSGDTFPVTVSSGVTVNELTCTADDVKYTTGVTFGTVGTVVVDDNTVPGGNAIVIGGHLVNKLAVGQTEAKLTKAGDKVEEMMGKTVYVAGYTAADTVAAVNSLVAQIKAL